jgi:hypothetical protein
LRQRAAISVSPWSIATPARSSTCSFLGTRRERPGSPRRTWVYVEGCQGARNEVWRSKLTQWRA